MAGWACVIFYQGRYRPKPLISLSGIAQSQWFLNRWPKQAKAAMVDWFDRRFKNHLLYQCQQICSDNLVGGEWDGKTGGGHHMWGQWEL